MEHESAAEDTARRQNEADAYRLHQAEQLLRRAGYLEQPDGSWVPPEKPPTD